MAEQTKLLEIKDLKTRRRIRLRKDYAGTYNNKTLRAYIRIHNLRWKADLRFRAEDRGEDAPVQTQDADHLPGSVGIP